MKDMTDHAIAARRAYEKHANLNRDLSLARLTAMIPTGCPLAVTYDVGAGFRVWQHGYVMRAGRFEVIAAWIEGYRAALENQP